MDRVYLTTCRFGCLSDIREICGLSVRRSGAIVVALGRLRSRRRWVVSPGGCRWTLVGVWLSCLERQMGVSACVVVHPGFYARQLYAVDPPPIDRQSWTATQWSDAAAGQSVIQCIGGQSLVSRTCRSSLHGRHPFALASPAMSRALGHVPLLLDFQLFNC